MGGKGSGRHSKLTDEQRKQLIADEASGNYDYEQLAAKYGIIRQTIYLLMSKRGKNE